MRLNRGLRVHSELSYRNLSKIEGIKNSAMGGVWDRREQKYKCLYYNGLDSNSRSTAGTPTTVSEWVGGGQ